jgi:hypothetical protein
VTTFGLLEIEVVAKTDGAGPSRVGFRWPWYWHLPRLGPWLLLALAIALPRRNRHPHALLLFVPMLILGLWWPRITGGAGTATSTEPMSSILVESLTVGLALLWLNAEKVGRCRGPVRFTGSLGILLLGESAVVASYWGTFPHQTGLVLTFTTIMVVALLAALTRTRRLVHQRYDPLRFLLGLAAWCTVCAIVGVAAFVAVQRISNAHGVTGLLTTIGSIIVTGLGLSLCLYAVSLPYLLLMFTSPFFRRRFYVWLGAGAES